QTCALPILPWADMSATCSAVLSRSSCANAGSTPSVEKVPREDRSSSRSVMCLLVLGRLVVGCGGVGAGGLRADGFGAGSRMPQQGAPRSARRGQACGGCGDHRTGIRCAVDGQTPVPGRGAGVDGAGANGE